MEEKEVRRPWQLSDEQLDRLKLTEGFHFGEDLSGIGYGERRQWVGCLAEDVQPLAAGHQDLHARAVPQDYLGVARRYYEPSDQGLEKQIKERLEMWRNKVAQQSQADKKSKPGQ